MSVHVPFVYRRPAWGQGMITQDDARFVHELILEVRPQIAIEIGVASGCSSVAILEAMRLCRDLRSATDAGGSAVGGRYDGSDPEAADTGVRPDRVWLHAFDITERCYFDASQPTGGAVAELTPWNLKHYQFAVGDALAARAQCVGMQVPFAFIDASHLHPWATADLIALLLVLAPSAWVVLHDVRLPFVEGRAHSRGHGPRHLFEAWPGEKRQGGTDGNCGAIRLPADLAGVIPILQRSLGQPWEVALPGDVCAALSIAARPPGVISKPDALRIVAKAAARRRPLYVCGAGVEGRALAGELRRRELRVSGFVDRDRSKQGEVVDGLRIESRENLSLGSDPRPFMVLSRRRATQIDDELTSSGWRRGKDYVVVW